MIGLPSILILAAGLWNLISSGEAYEHPMLGLAISIVCALIFVVPWAFILSLVADSRPFGEVFKMAFGVGTLSTVGYFVWIWLAKVPLGSGSRPATKTELAEGLIEAGDDLFD